MKRNSFRNWHVLLALAVLLVSGCSGKAKDVKTVEGDPETSINRASLFSTRGIITMP